MAPWLVVRGHGFPAPDRGREICGDYPLVGYGRRRDSGGGARVAALLLIVVATQGITAFGAGGWFPNVAPALWVGMGGPDAAATIFPTQAARRTGQRGRNLGHHRPVEQRPIT